MSKISKENNPIRQHHVPKSYLRNFCNSSKAIAVMDKRSQRVFSTGISAVGVENNFYTLEKMEDPYHWERAYAAGMDSRIGELMTKVISQTNLLVRNGTIIINNREKAQLAAIMVMQLLRGKQGREHMRKDYQNYLPNILREIKEVLGPMNDEHDKLLQAYENDEYYFKRISMDIALDSKRLTRYAEILCNYDFLFYRICGDMEFITSDNPVMFINSITSDACPFTNGLLRSSTAVYYPISPKLLLCAMQPEFTFGTFSGRDCCIVDLDVDKEVKFISTINRKQVEQCFQQAFARSADVLKKVIPKTNLTGRIHCLQRL